MRRLKFSARNEPGRVHRRTKGEYDWIVAAPDVDWRVAPGLPSANPARIDEWNDLR